MNRSRPDSKHDSTLNARCSCLKTFRFKAIAAAAAAAQRKVPR